MSMNGTTSKQKYYNLGNLRATARMARQKHMCNCCLVHIEPSAEYREVQRLPSRQFKEDRPIRLHVECFRSLMRNIRNAMEMLTIESSAIKEDKRDAKTKSDTNN